MRTRPLPALVAAAALVLAPVAGAGPTSAAAKAPARKIAYTDWGTRADFAAGHIRDVRVAHGRLRLDGPSGTRRIGGKRYDAGQWTSRWTRPGFALTELVPSWNATTPEGTLIEVRVRGRSGGRTSSWDNLGRWASGDGRFHRTSLGSQPDDSASVNVDTWEAHRSFAAWQLQVRLLRERGTGRTPRVDSIGAMVSRIPSSTGVATSKPGVARGITLPVPKFSQMIHEGHYAKYGGGGEAWCSPTSTAMVLGYYHALPPRSETAWVGKHRDRVVDHSARMTYDYSYDGTGNWPFNTAYAGTRVKQAFVTRLASLRDVERLVKAGIPVVTSITFGSGELDNAPIGSTNGHLLVVVGFTRSGKVVVNDPAAGRKAGVRRTYRRGQFEDAWLKRGSHGGSGGIAYIVRDGAHPLPARYGSRRW